MTLPRLNEEAAGRGAGLVRGASRLRGGEDGAVGQARAPSLGVNVLEALQPLRLTPRRVRRSQRESQPRK